VLLRLPPPQFLPSQITAARMAELFNFFSNFRSLRFKISHSLCK
jgi:hypothetical protein